jgi:hypothetical protein
MFGLSSLQERGNGMGIMMGLGIKTGPRIKMGMGIKMRMRIIGMESYLSKTKVGGSFRYLQTHHIRSVFRRKKY